MVKPDMSISKAEIVTASTKALIVLIPSFFAAWLTGEMIWVIPTLVAAGFIASSIDPTKRVEEDEVDIDSGIY